MPNINKVIIGGNLARDPELRVTPNGTAICQFSIANNRNYKNQAGESVSEVSFVDVEAWGKTGEIIAKYFQKGSPILVHGRLKMDQWEDKNSGQKRSKLKVVITFPEGGFDFVGGKGGSEAGQDGQDGQAAPAGRAAPPARAANAGQATQARRPAKETTPAIDQMEEDIPF